MNLFHLIFLLIFYRENYVSGQQKLGMKRLLIILLTTLSMYYFKSWLQDN